MTIAEQQMALISIFFAFSTFAVAEGQAPVFAAAAVAAAAVAAAAVAPAAVAAAAAAPMKPDQLALSAAEPIAEGESRQRLGRHQQRDYAALCACGMGGRIPCNARPSRWRVPRESGGAARASSVAIGGPLR